MLAVRLAAASLFVATAMIAASITAPMAAAAPPSQEKVYRATEDKGVTLPQVVREVKPTYTPEAMRARIQGTVWLTAVVLPNGAVGDVTVVKSLDDEHGLDEQASGRRGSRSSSRGPRMASRSRSR